MGKRLGKEILVMPLPPKTKLMKHVEAEQKRQLKELLRDFNRIGLTATAEELGVSNATLGAWLQKLGITKRRVALAPGETLEVKRIAKQ